MFNAIIKNIGDMKELSGFLPGRKLLKKITQHSRKTASGN